jgi:hypothetical protein
MSEELGLEQVRDFGGVGVVSFRSTYLPEQDQASEHGLVQSNQS